MIWPTTALCEDSAVTIVVVAAPGLAFGVASELGAAAVTAAGVPAGEASPEPDEPHALKAATMARARATPRIGGEPISGSRDLTPKSYRRAYESHVDIAPARLYVLISVRRIGHRTLTGPS